MKVCRFRQNQREGLAFWRESRIVPLDAAVRVAGVNHDFTAVQQDPNGLLQLLPHGSQHTAARQLHDLLDDHEEAVVQIGIPVKETEILTPIPKPPKLLLLAGNYAKHIEEGGGIAVEREKTFPYVFMKPPSTTLNHHEGDIAIPTISPDHIDWEVELAVVIGKRTSKVTEADALGHVAGYTIINDISNRKFTPNPDREERKRDGFFDWLHGKWFDGFCPAGPCIIAADTIPDPQNLDLTLKVNGTVHQNANTRLQIFPVAAVVAFISSYVTLEPGDIISTGTPAGVGHGKGVYLKPGDITEATISGIGTLRNHFV